MILVMSQDMSSEFREELYRKYQKTKKCLLPEEKYFEIISDMMSARAARKRRKTRRQYAYLSRYEILQSGPTPKLIRKRRSPDEPPVFFVTIEDTYEVIHAAHIATKHGGRDKMLKQLEKTYANVQRESLELFKANCTVCKERTKRLKDSVVRPIVLPNASYSRGQVDLMDYQLKGDAEHTWIMVYQDQSTTFCVLRPLTSNRACEVALQLLDVFTLLGAPVILHSRQGLDFTAAVIKQLKQMWPELRLVHGHPQYTLGSAETTDIDNLLNAWMKENNTTRWSLGLRFVQFTKNRMYSAAVKRSPFKAMFGVEPRVGLSSTFVPEDLLDRLQTEDDLLALESCSDGVRTDQGGGPAQPPGSDEATGSSSDEDPDGATGSRAASTSATAPRAGPAGPVHVTAASDLCRQAADVKRHANVTAYDVSHVTSVTARSDVSNHAAARATASDVNHASSVTASDVNHATSVTASDVSHATSVTASDVCHATSVTASDVNHATSVTTSDVSHATENVTASEVMKVSTEVDLEDSVGATPQSHDPARHLSLLEKQGKEPLFHPHVKRKYQLQQSAEHTAKRSCV